MREIKLRGKRIDDGKWIYGDLIHEQDKVLIRYLHPDGQYLSFEVLPETVGQYTGLKDKNGRGIYQGDIIKKPNRSSNLYEIIYQDSISGFRCKVIKGDIKSFPCLNIGTVRNYEVIGNIYEKTELLEEEHE